MIETTVTAETRILSLLFDISKTVTEKRKTFLEWFWSRNCHSNRETLRSSLYINYKLSARSLSFSAELKPQVLKNSLRFSFSSPVIICSLEDHPKKRMINSHNPFPACIYFSNEFTSRGWREDYQKLISRPCFAKSLNLWKIFPAFSKIKKNVTAIMYFLPLRWRDFSRSFSTLSDNAPIHPKGKKRTTQSVML